MNSNNALHHAWQTQHDASKVGFDWNTVDGPLEKVGEELRELQHAIASNDLDSARDELGDLLFAVVNASRFLNTHPNDALLEATAKFARRFNAVKDSFESNGRSMTDCTLEELDVEWDRVKASESDSKK